MTAQDAPRYVVTKKDGIDTLHRNPREQCNLDDTDRDLPIDEFSAERMLLYGDVRPCGHCMREGWG